MSIQPEAVRFTLLDLAAEASPSPQAVRALERDIAASMEAAAVAGYRLP